MLAHQLATKRQPFGQAEYDSALQAVLRLERRAVRLTGSSASRSLRAGRRGDCGFRVAHPLVAARLQVQGQLASSGLDDATFNEDVHEVGRDVVEDALVVRHQDERLIWRAEGV